MLLPMVCIPTRLQFAPGIGNDTVSKVTVPCFVPLNPLTESVKVLSKCQIAFNPVLLVKLFLHFLHLFESIWGCVLATDHNLNSSILPEAPSDPPRPILISALLLPGKPTKGEVATR